MTPSIFDDVTTRTLETKKELEQVLMQFEGVNKLELILSLATSLKGATPYVTPH
jgi:hypothetical protein